MYCIDLWVAGTKSGTVNTVVTVACPTTPPPDHLMSMLDRDPDESHAAFQNMECTSYACEYTGGSRIHCSTRPARKARRGVYAGCCWYKLGHCTIGLLSQSSDMDTFTPSMGTYTRSMGTFTPSPPPPAWVLTPAAWVLTPAAWVHSPLQYGYFHPQHGYLHPQHGYLHPQHGYLHPQNGYFNPQHGYVHPRHGYSRSTYSIPAWVL